MRADLIDISSNNGAVTFPVVASAGVKAVMHKATEGVGSFDSQCLTRCAQAKASGLKVGVYHYLRVRHGRPQDAAQQAADYLKVWKEVSPDLLPCVDVESAYNTDPATTPAGPATQAECQQAVLEFVAAIRQATGYSPIIYTSHGEWISMGLAALSTLASCPLWIASYGDSATAPPPWTTFVAWQWSGSGQLPGVSGPVDLSQCDDLSLLMPKGLGIVTGYGLIAGLILLGGLAYYAYARLG